MTGRVGRSVAAVAIPLLAIARPCLAARYGGMTQDLLLRSGPSPFRVVFWICLVLALGLTLHLLMRLKGRFDAGRPVQVGDVAALGTVAVFFWLLVWLSGGLPSFAPLYTPLWLVD